MAKKSKKQKAKKAKPIQVKKPTNSFWKNSDHLIKLALLMVVTIAAFYTSLSNDFVNWDDDVNILDNENLVAFDWTHIKAIFTTDVIGGYNPLTIFTFALEKHFFGFDPFVFHLNNLLLHLVCVYFVYRILLLLRLSPMAALIGALLFGIHPMRVESVAWATERKDVLFGAFYLAATYTYLIRLKAQEGQKMRLFLITMLLFALSLLSKIQAVAFPMTLLAIDYYLKRPLKWKLLIEKIPYFALSLIVGIMGVVVLSQAETLTDDVTNYTFGDRLLVGAFSYILYLVKWIYPYEMLPLYPYPVTLNWVFKVAPIGVLAVLAGVYMAFLKDKRAYVFAWAVYTFNVFFVLQILAAGQGFKADRFTYIPYLGLFFIMAWGYEQLSKKWPKYQTLLAGGLGIYLLLFAYMTHQQCKVWKNGATLWTHVLMHETKSALPWGNRANYYRGQKNYQQSLNDYQQAIKLAPTKPNPYNSLGKTYFDMGNAKDALVQYNKAIELKDDEVEFRVNRGACYASLGNFNNALIDLNAAEKIDPEFKNLYLNRSLIYSQSQQYDLALRDHDIYLELDPYHDGIHYERAIIKRRKGDEKAALVDLDRAIQLNNSEGIYLHERAKVHFRLGDKARAAQDVRAAQQLGTAIEPALLQSVQ